MSCAMTQCQSNSCSGKENVNLVTYRMLRVLVWFLNEDWWVSPSIIKPCSLPGFFSFQIFANDNRRQNCWNTVVKWSTLENKTIRNPPLTFQTRYRGTTLFFSFKVDKTSEKPRGQSVSTNCVNDCRQGWLMRRSCDTNLVQSSKTLPYYLWRTGACWT